MRRVDRAGARPGRRSRRSSSRPRRRSRSRRRSRGTAAPAMPKRSAYQRCTRASLRISTGTGRSANRSAPGPDDGVLGLPRRVVVEVEEVGVADAGARRPPGQRVPHRLEQDAGGQPPVADARAPAPARGPPRTVGSASTIARKRSSPSRPLTPGGGCPTARGQQRGEQQDRRRTRPAGRSAPCGVGVRAARCSTRRRAGSRPGRAGPDRSSRATGRPWWRGRR